MNLKYIIDRYRAFHNCMHMLFYYVAVIGVILIFVKLISTIKSYLKYDIIRTLRMKKINTNLKVKQGGNITFH